MADFPTPSAGRVPADAGGGEASPPGKKLALYTIALSATQRAALGDYCASHSAFEPTQTPYTHFSYKSKAKGLNIAAYTSGKVVISGKGTADFVSNVLEPEITGEARLGYDAVRHPEWFSLHAGLDESGKGDLFGPVVAACVIGGRAEVEKWLAAGIRDSKQISGDKKIFALEKIIRATPGAIVKTAFAHTEKYNALYPKFGNLNALLGHLHFLALREALAEARERDGNAGKMPEWGLLDQFSKSPIVQRELARSGLSAFDLRMRTRAESDPVVAAASIVARATYVRELGKLEKLAGTPLPKGSGSEAKRVARAVFEKVGRERFGCFVKLHFKTAAEAQGLPPPASSNFFEK